MTRYRVPHADRAIGINAEFMSLDSFAAVGFGAGGDFGGVHDVGGVELFDCARLIERE